MTSPRKKAQSEEPPKAIMVRLLHIVDSEKILHKLFSADIEPRNARVGMRLALVQRKLDIVRDEFNKQRGKLLKKFGYEDDEREGWYHFWRVKPDPEKGTEGIEDTEALDAYNEAINNIAEELVAVDAVITETDLEKVGAGFSAAEQMKLAWLISELRDTYDPHYGFDDDPAEDDEEPTDEEDPDDESD